MKVGILTFHYAYNYGAALQAYGLQKALQELGFKPSIIDYRSLPIMAHNRGLGILSGRFLSVIKMRSRFKTFQEDHMLLSKRLYNAKAIIRETKDYKALIVGSDQVWNTNATNGDTIYFLDIPLSKHIKKISYAACFGEEEIKKSSKQHISRYLSNFDFISVRNMMSANIVSKYHGTMPKVVLDPTVLTDFTLVTSKKISMTPYILVYALHRGKDEKKMTQLVNEAKKTINLPVYSISQRWDFPIADCYIRNIGPSEWLTYFEQAAFIITDSFHGLLFALKYQKPFMVSALNNKANRIIEIVNKYTLSDRVILNDADMPKNEIYKYEIDYSKISQNMDRDVQESREFLLRALSA